MTDVLPVVFISPDEHLRVELVGRHGYRPHVGWKLEKQWNAFWIQKSQCRGKRSRGDIFVRAGQHKTPFAERRHIHVVRKSLESRLVKRFDNAPERIAREHRRSALHHHKSLGTEMPRHRSVKRRGEQLAERIIL